MGSEPALTVYDELADYPPRPNRATRRAAAKSRTDFASGRHRWRPTQVPVPRRIGDRRRRNKAARASRKLNR